MKKRASIDDLLMAAEWLDVNEGDNGERESCWRVAELLRREAEARGREITVRRVAKQNNTSKKIVREAIKRATKS